MQSNNLDCFLFLFVSYGSLLNIVFYILRKVFVWILTQPPGTLTCVDLCRIFLSMLFMDSTTLKLTCLDLTLIVAPSFFGGKVMFLHQPNRPCPYLWYQKSWFHIWYLILGTQPIHPNLTSINYGFNDHFSLHQFKHNPTSYKWIWTPFVHMFLGNMIRFAISLSLNNKIFP